MSRTSGSGQGTKNHKPGCLCTVCKRVRGRQEPTGEAKVGGFGAPIAVPSIAEAHELVNNPKALELAQKLAKVEGERATKQRQYNGLETLFSNVRTECETLKRDLRDQTARLEAENLSLLTSNTALRGRAEIAERAKAEAEAHAANLQEGNARLARESAEKDGLLADYRQALLDNDRAGQGGAIILAALVAVVTACATWLVRGWVR